MSAAKRVVVARVGAAHGIRGEVRVKSFTAEPTDISAYGPLEAADGRRFTVASARRVPSSPDMLVVRFREVADRNAAEALNGTELSVQRESLPEPDEDEFYHADLIGLPAVTQAGEPLGTVIAIPNYGAGDLIEIAPAAGPTLLFPFTRANVPDIDLKAGRVTVVPPVEVEGEGDPAEEQ